MLPSNEEDFDDDFDDDDFDDDDLVTQKKYKRCFFYVN